MVDLVSLGVLGVVKMHMLFLVNWLENFPRYKHRDEISTLLEKVMQVLLGSRFHVLAVISIAAPSGLIQKGPISCPKKYRRTKVNIISSMQYNQIELSFILDQEESIWRQKSRSDWISLGDRNTRYYHRRAISRKQKHKITSLKLSNGEWCDNDNVLEAEAVKFFTNLFAHDDPMTTTFPITGDFPVLPYDLLQSLDDVPSTQEIRDALKDMAPLKCPGWDGLHAEFFQHKWHIVGESICAMIQGIFRGEQLEECLNKTILVLIPKSDSPESFADFRPISLCTILYKLLTKLIVRRLKPLFPKLIASNQTNFISRRSIVDNIIVNQEVIHSMRTSKLKNGWMAIKVYLEKAFDRLHWKFISDTLIDAGFPPGIRSIIMNCVTSSRFQVQWNGKLSLVFHPQRGIRQGDPLSPYLFVLAMERLGHLINHTVRMETWEPFRFVRNGTSLSHLFFADDLILYAKADISQAETIKESFLPPLIRSHDSRSIHWTGPEPGWVCLNVDATVSALTSFGSVAGLLRDQTGSWLSGFQKAIGVLQPLQAELWAVLIGLRFVWDQGFVLVQIQSDCAEAVKLIKADNAYMSPISLVRAIAALRQKAWATEITWIPRTSNLPADMLAKSVDPSSTDFHELAEPPVALMPLLSMDALHLSL
ncbi:hypothetical protein GQ457_09G014670 [Hibiscus cannabinus]